MPDFLLELRSEEIPARMQAGARADLEKLFRKEMDAAGVTLGEITVWSTPRRLALIARGLPDSTQAVSEETKGPRTSAPDRALDGFLRKTGLTKDQLTERDGVWYAVVEKPGRAVRAVLAEAIPAIVRAFPWPKSMRWGTASLSTESLRWIRPLSGIVAILGEDLVECEAGGTVSGFMTIGHRFHGPGPITIGGASDYQEKLRACHVIVDHVERQDLIREGAVKAAADAGLSLVADEGLVIENAGLTEWPVPLLGLFDAAFLDVPPEVIQLTARTNQKYFVCEDAEGKLANAFVCTANIDAEDGGAAIVDGNRKVLAARLSDARFFWEQDRKTPLAEHARKLERITFHEKLGTVADKVERVAKLARWLVEEGIVRPSPVQGRGLGEGAANSGSSDSPHSPTLSPEGERETLAAPATPSAQPEPVEGHAPTGEGSARASTSSARADLADMAEQAARLAKADLVTEMVGEFPELQGLMGGYYARAEGLPDAVADAIRDHYKPVGQGDEVPTAPVTVAVSLADKLDTLFTFFVVDEKPTGSKDPFALRRAAISILRLITSNRVRLPMTIAIRSAVFPILTAASEDVLAQSIAQQAISKQLSEVEATYGKMGGGGETVSRVQSIFSGIEFIDADDTLLRTVLNQLKHDKIVSDLLDFFADRLKVQQREAGVRHDLIDAVFALGGEDDLVRLLARVKALQSFMATEDGANLLAGYKRAANILKKEDWRGHEGEIARTGEEDPLALVDDPDLAPVIAAKMAERHEKTLSYTPEPDEDALIKALDAAEPTATAAVEAEDFGAAMSALASLRSAVDAFFDSVTVNDPDAAKRAARLDLLARLRDAVHRVADFSRIEG